LQLGSVTKHLLYRVLWPTGTFLHGAFCALIHIACNAETVLCATMKNVEAVTLCKKSQPIHKTPIKLSEGNTRI